MLDALIFWCNSKSHFRHIVWNQEFLLNHSLFKVFDKMAEIWNHLLNWAFSKGVQFGQKPFLRIPLAENPHDFTSKLNADLAECLETVSVSIPTYVNTLSIQSKTVCIEIALCGCIKLNKSWDLISWKYLVLPTEDQYGHIYKGLCFSQKYEIFWFPWFFPFSRFCTFPKMEYISRWVFYLIFSIKEAILWNSYRWC